MDRSLGRERRGLGSRALSGGGGRVVWRPLSSVRGCLCVSRRGWRGVRGTLVSSDVLHGPERPALPARLSGSLGGWNAGPARRGTAGGSRGDAGDFQEHRGGVSDSLPRNLDPRSVAGGAAPRGTAHPQGAATPAQKSGPSTAARTRGTARTGHAAGPTHGPSSGSNCGDGFRGARRTLCGGTGWFCVQIACSGCSLPAAASGRSFFVGRSRGPLARRAQSSGGQIVPRGCHRYRGETFWIPADHSEGT